MKVCTRDCQMAAFITSLGEVDLIPYCSFMDLANAESRGYNLQQTSSTDSGVCDFCFNKKGKVNWPELLRRLTG